MNAFNKGDGDACGWYWVNIVVDCTLGVGVNYLLLTVGPLAILVQLLFRPAQAFCCPTCWAPWRRSSSGPGTMVDPRW